VAAKGRRAAVLDRRQALLQRRFQVDQGALAPLLQAVGLDPDLSCDGPDRFTSQQPRDDVSLARRAPALDRLAGRCLSDGG